MNKIIVTGVLLVAILLGASPASVLAAPAQALDLQVSYTCPCSIWDNSAVPGGYYRNQVPIESGMKFRSDVNGYVTGVRFYKNSYNTGTHVAHLWTRTGSLLASATFGVETPYGWQTVYFASPVAINANT